MKWQWPSTFRAPWRSRPWHSLKARAPPPPSPRGGGKPGGDAGASLMNPPMALYLRRIIKGSVGGGANSFFSSRQLFGSPEANPPPWLGWWFRTALVPSASKHNSTLRVLDVGWPLVQMITPGFSPLTPFLLPATWMSTSRWRASGRSRRPFIPPARPPCGGSPSVRSRRASSSSIPHGGGGNAPSGPFSTKPRGRRPDSGKKEPRIIPHPPINN